MLVVTFEYILFFFESKAHLTLSYAIDGWTTRFVSELSEETATQFATSKRNRNNAMDESIRDSLPDTAHGDIRTVGYE